MELTYLQKQHLLEQGYVVVPGVIPKILIERALKWINHSIGNAAEWKNHTGEPAIVDLFNRTPVKTLIDSLIGEEMYYPIKSAQVAPRYPVYADPAPAPHPHLDGLLELHNGVVQNFTALIGVLLSDLDETDAGNFTVWPGTHKSHEQYFREHTPDIMLQEESFRTIHHSPNVPKGEPRQITGKAGDVVIVHYLTLHTAAANIKHNIRYACFFRVQHKDRDRDWRAPLLEMWRHWPGLQNLT
jgi:ectoine hydroxylase-related dioxygenase (phytanoyl-CoA dioxygenase family)